MATQVKQPPSPPKIRSARKPAPFFIEFYRSSMGKKFTMAVTGLIGLGFVLSHMAGNFKLYLGGHEIDVYGEFLRELAYPILPKTALLWILRLVLIGALVLHVHAAYSLSYTNRKARPTNYQGTRNYEAATFASRSMRWTGTIVLLYILFHLADLTWGVEAVNGEWVRGAVYSNLTYSLGRPLVALFYILANTALAVHVWHGVWSLFQTLGLNNKRFNQWRNLASYGVAGAILVGNLSFPILVQLDAVRPCGLFSEDTTCEPPLTEETAEAHSE